MGDDDDAIVTSSVGSKSLDGQHMGGNTLAVWCSSYDIHPPAVVSNTSE
jgi:hypothetical protein